MKNYGAQQPLMIEKIIAGLSYITFGFVGFIWLLIGIFTKNSLRPYLKYHIFQSIFISIAYFLVCQFLGLILNILSIIPFINQIVMQITLYLNMPLFFGFSIIQVAIYAVIFYLVATSFQGKYSYIPWISEIIKANVRNS
ncbi:MAG TPA: hypothetical protein PLG15_01025 [Candidatus Gastranaerophilaceae bacterium]|nr:hypothetical protein [Candidatus Gastranaerophilaceae bacterium]HPT40949.1 hypothetical protein [Candidatus Gastranaerophilaceae bacterium]